MVFVFRQTSGNILKKIGDVWQEYCKKNGREVLLAAISPSPNSLVGQDFAYEIEFVWPFIRFPNERFNGEDEGDKDA